MNQDLNGNQITMETIHGKIHQGEVFYWSERLSAQTGTLDYLVRTGSVPVHLNLTLSASVSTTIDIIEAPTVTVVGTAIPTFNYLRSSTHVSKALVYKGPTSTLGTIIRQSRAGSGSTPGQGQTSSTSADLEYILKANTDYVFRHVPSASADLLYTAFFYEQATPVGA